MNWSADRFVVLLFSTLGVSLLAKAAGLLMAILLGRALGPEAFGVFVFAQGVGLILGRFSTLGWGTLSTRQIPIFIQQQNFPMLKGIDRMGLAIVLVSSVTMAALVWVASELLTNAEDRASMSRALAMAAILIPAYAFRHFYRQKLAALRMPALAVLLDEMLAPLAVVLLTFLPEITSFRANLAYAIASLVGATIAAAVVARKINTLIEAHEASFDTKVWVKSGLLLIAAVSAKLLMNKTDVVMLAPLSTFEQTGYYGAAFRLTYAITFPQIAVSLVISPRIASSYSNGNIPGVVRELKRAAVFTLITALITVLPITLAPEFVLTLIYGPAYAEAWLVLVVLALSQAFAAFGVIFATLASMTSKEKILATTTWLALLLNLGLNYVFIPQYGALAAALTSLFSIVVLVSLNIYLVLFSVLRQGASKD